MVLLPYLKHNLFMVGRTIALELYCLFLEFEIFYASEQIETWSKVFNSFS